MKPRSRTDLPKHFIVLLLMTMITLLALPVACIDDGEPPKFVEPPLVWPLYRCSHDDVRASWKTSSDDPIKITVAGNTVDAPGTGDWRKRASDFNAYGDKVDIVFNIPGGETITRKVETIRGLQKYSRRGSLVEASSYAYKIDLPVNIWSGGLCVYELSLIKPRSCAGTNGDIPFQWQYDKGMGLSGYLVKENDYRESFHPEPSNPQPKAVGVWLFKLQNPSNERACPEWPTMDKVPEVVFTVGCIRE